LSVFSLIINDSHTNTCFFYQYEYIAIIWRLEQSKKPYVYDKTIS
jgi:uncharacterized membrane protein YqjE